MPLMTRYAAGPLSRYQLVSFLILLAGLGSSIAIYLTAGPSADMNMVNEFEVSKRYAHDLELYGGKANVIADKFSHWFDGLWHGQSLAFTVAVLTITASAGYFLIARRLAQHAAYEAECGCHRNEPD